MPSFLILGASSAQIIRKGTSIAGEMITARLVKTPSTSGLKESRAQTSGSRLRFHVCGKTAWIDHRQLNRFSASENLNKFRHKADLSEVFSQVDLFDQNVFWEKTDFIAALE